MHHTVYKTTNLVNGLYYIGVHKTKDPNDKYLGSGTAFLAELLKFGSESFRKEILFDFETPEEAYQKENELVDLSDPKCLNLSPGGRFDLKWTDNERKRIRGPGNSQFGTCWITKDQKNKKISKDTLSSWMELGWSKGRYWVVTEENKRREENKNRDYLHSEEYREKFLQAVKSDKVRKNMSNAQKGKTLSETHRRKIAESVTGFVHTEETKKKISETKRANLSR